MITKPLEKVKEEKQAEAKEVKNKPETLLRKKGFYFTRAHIIGLFVAIGLVLIALILFFTTEFFDQKLLFFIIGISFVTAGLPFFATLIFETKSEQNKESMFLEFARDLVEGVKSGTSISKSIMNVKSKDYGKLNPHITKLSNQISMGISVREALDNFAKDVKNRVVTRAITLIQEAERAGGKIETILESVAQSVGQIEKLRKERRAAISNLVVQGYIVFLIFIAIMLVMQFRILPITSEIGTAGAGGLSEGFDLGITGTGESGRTAAEAQVSVEDMARSFLYLLVVQGFFVGLVIGKISEGSVKAGLKHSFILVTLAIIISTGATVLLG